METTSKKVEFAPYRKPLINGEEHPLSEWNGWEISNSEGSIIGYCCKVMHHRTPRWHITYDMPKYDNKSNVVDMSQFIADGELNLGRKTLKEATELLVDLYCNDIIAANEGPYGRNK